MREKVMVAHEGEDLKRGHIKFATHICKNVIIPLRITKMPLWVENVGPMTWTG